MDMAVPNCLHQIRSFQAFQDGGIRSLLIIRSKKEFFSVGRFFLDVDSCRMRYCSSFADRPGFLCYRLFILSVYDSLFFVCFRIAGSTPEDRTSRSKAENSGSGSFRPLFIHRATAARAVDR